ncbi:MAG TPA: NAD(P)-dependent oxidoreductase [Dermatophilaceae bacterium]|nr:NAD(P)-dependent oxidoreductase [Dermatophilaceae bacterium]
MTATPVRRSTATTVRRSAATPVRRSTADLTRLLDFPALHRHVLVIGGGHVAARRVHALARKSVPVTVVARAICDELFDLLAEGRISWENRSPVESDLDGVWLVHVATGDPDADAAVCGWVETRRRMRAEREARTA